MTDLDAIAGVQKTGHANGAVAEPGLALLRMRSTSDMQRWITRRVDEITFLDHATARRRVRLDLDLDGLTPGQVATKGGYWLLPLARLSRTGHTTLAVHDERGAVLPRLNMDQERSLACAGALRVAAQILEHEPDEGANAAVAAVLNDSLPANKFDDRLKDSDRRSLAGQPEFLDLLNELRRSFHLVALVPVGSPKRRVLTYEYLEQPSELFSVPEGRTPWAWRVQNAATNALWPPVGVYTQFKVETPGEAASYHVELTAPYDIELHDGVLVGPWSDDGEESLYEDDDPSLTTAHGFCRPRPTLDGGVFEVRLSPSRSGMTRSSVLTTGSIFGVIAGTWVFAYVSSAHHLMSSPDRSSATSVLLLAPAVLAATLAAPSRHSMTTALLRSTRFTVALACLAAFVSAAALAFRLSKPHLLCVLLVTGVAAGLLWARLAVQFTRLAAQRRHPTADTSRRRPTGTGDPDRRARGAGSA